MEAADSLNSSQKFHLLNNCQYADKLLSEIEGILTAASSKSPFPRYQVDISAAQSKVVQDYIARIRAQMLRILEAQGIPPPGPKFGAIHSIRVTLAFVRIALTEMGPRYMRGYGEIPDSAIPELNGVVSELEGLAGKLDAYLAQGLGQDLQGRLDRLERTGDQVSLLRELERMIAGHGLVELRPTLSMIVDRLESNRFEIAVFGRVSSGKSSLLNHILQSDVLPVGVNPITAVPTRLVHGSTPRLTVAFADRHAQQFEIERLAEFATEQGNPANSKGVTRITVELPSPRLREGVVFVDTPGLGSLATAGAAETRAYLPQCDLGVVLINAGSALSEEDLATIQALFEAAAPASVVLSKADLLGPDDRESALKYVTTQIHSRLGLDLVVSPVSIIRGHASLLDGWFEEQIAPLYDRHKQLAEASVRRKAGALREAVRAALRSKLERAGVAAPAGVDRLKEVEAGLRRAAGRIPEAQAFCLNSADEVRNLTPAALKLASSRLVDGWLGGDGAALRAADTVSSAIAQAVAERVNLVYSTLEGLGRDLSKALQSAAAALGVNEVPGEEELTSSLREMPRLDLGSIRPSLRRPFLLAFGKKIAKRWVAGKLRREIGPPVSEALRWYGKSLEAWVRRALSGLQARFDAHADAYRAQLERLAGATAISTEDREAIRRDLEQLANQPARLEEVTHGSRPDGC